MFLDLPTILEAGIADWSYSKAVLTFSAHARARGTIFFLFYITKLTFFIIITFVSSDVLYLKIDIEKPSFSILNSLTLECFAQIFNFKCIFFIINNIEINQNRLHATEQVQNDPNESYLVINDQNVFDLNIAYSTIVHSTRCKVSFQV